MRRFGRVGIGGAALLAVTAGTAVAASGGTATGPSSSQSPYIVPAAPGVVTKSILTVGDSVNDKADGTPYRYVGIPDGMGAFDNGDGTFSVLSNHEFPNNRGVARDHGAVGAHVSRWTIDKDTLEVLDGEDLIKQVSTWNSATSKYNAPALGVALNRLCSADLALKSAFYSPRTKKGYAGRIFSSGEEGGVEGRAFAHTLGGRSYELPAVGKMAFENVTANPATGDRTVVSLTDDGQGGQVYAYAGDKLNRGTVVQKAGLDNGHLFGIKVAGYPVEDPVTGIPSGTRFAGFDHGDVRNKTGAALDAESVAAGVTTFQRPEDSVWDPTNAGVLYFVTTASFTGNSRLWRLTFDDPRNPAAGGVIDMLLDGTEGQKMLDNMTADRSGRLVLEEDPGNQAHLAKIWSYEPKRDRLTLVAQSDPARFTPGVLSPFTQDEEHSGVIDASSILGKDWFLGDTQAHYANPDEELVEGGQMWALKIPSGRNGGDRDHDDRDYGDDDSHNHGGGRD